MKVKIKRLYDDVKMPSYAHQGDAGMDICSNEDVVIKAGERAKVSTGIAMEFEEGYVALVWDKSGLAGKKGIKTMAGVGDSCYRGEYFIVLYNTSNEDFVIKKGDKIAQVLFQKVERPEILEAGDLSDSDRGDGGFGSTGQ